MAPGPLRCVYASSFRSWHGAEELVQAVAICVARGVDLFDCVLPTRLARHGKALARDGDFSIRRVEWTLDGGPIEKDCDCVTCRRYSRGYIRHLRLTKERTADRLLTIHNLAYTYRLMSDIRTHIEAGTFDAFHREVIARRRKRVADSER